MVEIRTFEGAPEEMAEFLRRIWTSAGGGKVPTPLWSQEFLEWQFFSNPTAERDYILAAYDGTKLVAAFMALDANFRLKGRLCRGSLCSWLTVDPEYRSQFLAVQLVSAMRDRHAAHGAELFLGFGYPTDSGMSLEFWQAFARAWPDLVNTGPRIATWLRVLEPRTVLRASFTWLDKARTGLLGSMVPQIRDLKPNANVRMARAADAPACLQLLEHAARSLDVALVWDTPGLAHQLSYGSVAKTLVAVDEDDVAGWINFHYIDLAGPETMRVAIIDHFIAAARCRADLARHLLRGALLQMREDKASAAVAMRMPLWPEWTLFRCGFVPLHFGCRPILVSVRPNRQKQWSSSAYVLLR
jgi:GNAT superfamily N-acetyltransferase